MSGPRVAVVVPVYGNAATLRPLADRLATALAGRDWRLRLVVDASPDDSLAVAAELAADPRIGVTGLTVNLGQHRALATGLLAEDADVWVCLDADLQDPPEAVPLLLDRLARGDVGAVFAGRRGRYESPVRRLTGTLHRRLAARLTGLPPDAGAFLALGPEVRSAVVDLVLAGDAPSVVLAAGRAGRPLASVPVTRDRRPEGASAWTAGARLRQSLRSLWWAARRR
ncbi:undecaprenyl-phosphate 4-deoxy-4-formamido-L-arabinose transferase [Geodermatophilus telluris]|uniref:Undecaprenyl-phosphate 4-deoxy-4-formamido-L-arabinose transferase n=1 Tax=Geodermatophilus telluris TaxID=1190417 RepID=A0A1G6P8H8_9ACTN|nr:glycosyltransferase [Geodermatophilus telluris]SDC75914.1 undecaprenyl-phosphate 4-deoxy-4-formamido-L-arabinose transferase [Geodermatophilus telluris]